MSLVQSSSSKSYAALIAYLVLSKVLLSFIPVAYTDPSQAAIFAWPFMIVLIITGFIGISLADHTGFPQAMDIHISNRQRFLIPALLGVILGVLSLLINILLHLPKVDIVLPASVLVYSAGAIVVEVFYRLLPLPFFLWLISTVLLRNKGQELTFWILAVLLSTLEPLAQTHALISMGVSALPLALTLLVIYIANLIQAYFFRKYGLLASLTVRVSHYFIWHVLGSLLFQIL